MPAHIRFVLRVIELGLDAEAGVPIRADVVEELQALGRPSTYDGPVLVPAVFHLGYHGLWAQAEEDDAVRAELYRFDALMALERFAEAEECLRGAQTYAAQHLPIKYLDRRRRHAHLAEWSSGLTAVQIDARRPCLPAASTGLEHLDVVPERPALRSVPVQRPGHQALESILVGVPRLCHQCC